MTEKQYANSVLNAVRAGCKDYTEQDILAALVVTGDLSSAFKFSPTGVCRDLP